jgi:hypothetical protein
MRWLCVCQFGHSRSVGLTRALHGRGITAVAVGWATSGDALALLAEWADVIAILSSEMMVYVPEQFRHKVVDFGVGPDLWSNPYNTELAKLLERKLDNYFEKRGER